MITDALICLPLEITNDTDFDEDVLDQSGETVCDAIGKVRKDDEIVLHCTQPTIPNLQTEQKTARLYQKLSEIVKIASRQYSREAYGVFNKCP